ncbi:hypothetical protein [Burkholderia sp. 572]|uniref:hypothetical protein n=1 Tax=Burkholderia sp. 572 TaxID=3156414 RepID=UPI0033930182
MINPLGGVGIAPRNSSVSIDPSVSTKHTPTLLSTEAGAPRQRSSTLAELQGCKNEAPKSTSSASQSSASSNASEKNRFDLGAMLNKMVDFVKSLGEPLMSLFKMGADALSKVMGMVKSFV